MKKRLSILTLWVLICLLLGCAPLESRYERQCRQAYEQLQAAPALYVERRYQVTHGGDILSTYEAAYWILDDEFYVLCTDIDGGGAQEEMLYIDGQCYTRSVADGAQWQKGGGNMPDLNLRTQDWEELTELVVPQVKETPTGMTACFSRSTGHATCTGTAQDLSEVTFYFGEQKELTGIILEKAYYSDGHRTHSSRDRYELLSMDAQTIRQSIDAHAADLP